MGIVFRTKQQGGIHQPAQEREQSRRAIQGENGRSLVLQRREIYAAFLFVPGNVIPAHPGCQQIYLAEELFDSRSSQETIQHDKLILLPVATAGFCKIQSLNGTGNLLLDTESQMLHHSSRLQDAQRAPSSLIAHCRRF